MQYITVLLLYDIIILYVSLAYTYRTFLAKNASFARFCVLLTIYWTSPLKYLFKITFQIMLSWLCTIPELSKVLVPSYQYSYFFCEEHFKVYKAIFHSVKNRKIIKCIELKIIPIYLICIIKLLDEFLSLQEVFDK